MKDMIPCSRSDIWRVWRWRRGVQMVFERGVGISSAMRWIEEVVIWE